MNTTEVQPPPVRDPRRAVDEPALMGKRLIVAMEDPDMPGMPPQYVRDYRAASEVFEDSGRKFVHIVPEVEWYAWTTAPEADKTERPRGGKAWPADFCWVE